MAGGPGAAGLPASSARSLPRPRACRVPSWARRGMAPGGGGRRRAARSLPRSPSLCGPRQRPAKQSLLLVPGAAAQPRSPSAAALPFWSRSEPKKGRLARAGSGQAAAVPARVVQGRVRREGIPAPSLQPPPTARFALPPAGPLPPARPADGIRLSGRTGRLRASGAPAGAAREAGRCGPAASPARRAQRLCSLLGSAAMLARDRRREEASLLFLPRCFTREEEKGKRNGSGGKG